MSSTPCAVSRDELRNDLAQGPELTRDERETAERDAMADMLRVVPARGFYHHDGRTLVAEALAEADESDRHELTSCLQLGASTGEYDDADAGQIVRNIVEKYVRNQRDFEDVVQEQHNTRLAAQAEQALLDREE